MYRKIYVPIDNSEHANCCIEASVAIAKATGADVIGSHVYAGRLHDMRFRQMESSLPGKYQGEGSLQKQRRIHDSLIGTGLKLVSNAYLDVMEKRCKANNIPFERKTFDGRNYRELVRDIQANDYDLVVMGTHGQGMVNESIIGSVTVRVVRRIEVDTLVVKHSQSWGDEVKASSSNGPIVVTLDGSSHSFHGLKIGMFLARQFNRPLHGVAVYDPFLHNSIFHSIAGVLSDEDSKVFNFQKQEKLHEEVIDAGLAKIYHSHLEIGQKMAGAEGVEMDIALLPGKPFEKTLEYVRKLKAWLLICGRIGVHSDSDMDIGSNSENLLRMSPCHVLVSSRQFVPPAGLEAGELFKPQNRGKRT